MLYSGGNGTGLSFYIKYAEGSTENDPTVIAKGVDENGNEFEQTIHINKINPKCATVVEMRALEAHLSVDKNGGLSSLPPETGEMGLHDRADFMDMFQKTLSCCILPCPPCPLPCRISCCSYSVNIHFFKSSIVINYLYCLTISLAMKPEDMFQKQISDMRLLGQQKLVAYYQYSMQTYWDFMNKKYIHASFTSCGAPRPTISKAFSSWSAALPCARDACALCGLLGICSR